MTAIPTRQRHAAEAPGSARLPRRARRRAFFFLLPNLADDSELDVYAFRLLAHYQRVAGGDGTCAEPTTVTAARCRMSPRRVVQARTQLRDAGWIAVAYAGPVGQQVPVVSMVDRMADNLARYERPSAPAAVGSVVSETLDTAAADAAPVCTMDRPRLQQLQASPVPAGRTPDKIPEDSGTPP
jgi:hypothetical protein